MKAEDEEEIAVELTIHASCKFRVVDNACSHISTHLRTSHPISPVLTGL